MGGENSVSEQAIDIPSINHPKFQHVQFLKGNQIMKTSLSLDNYSDFQKWEQQLNKVARFDDQVLLFPKAYQCTRKAVCGSSAVLNIEFDNYQYVLKQELQNRFKIRKHFTQQQIWYLLYSLCQATHDFRSIHSRVGDIRPANIFINQDGQIKVSNLFSWPCESTNYDKTMVYKQLTYVAPQQIQGTKDGKIQIYIDKYKAQSFSLGLTVLQTGLLQTCSKLYNPKANTFNKYELTKIIKQWWDQQRLQYDLQVDQETGNQQNTYNSQYSIKLKLTVAALCDVNPDQRLSSQQVYNWLKPFKDEINGLQKFQSDLPKIDNIAKYQPFLINYKSKNQNIKQKQIKLNNNITQKPLKVQKSSNDKPTMIYNQTYQPPQQYQYKQQQPQIIQKVNFQNYQPSKLNQQPLHIINNNNVKKVQYPPLNSHYNQFRNSADSYRHNFSYTPNKINTNLIKQQYNKITHLNNNVYLNQDKSKININIINNKNHHNTVSYKGHPSRTLNHHQVTYKNVQISKNNSNNFLQRIDQSLAKSRKNNP